MPLNIPNALTWADLGAGAGFPGWGLVLAPVFESMMWPLVTMALLAPQRRPPDRDKNRPL